MYLLKKIKLFNLFINILQFLLALVLVGFTLILIFFSEQSEAGYDVKTYIPDKAKIYLPVLRKEQISVWPDHSMPELLAGLIEQESCISLTHSRCWSPTSQLKTSREEGAGLGQTTRAYNSNGSIRFDALKEIRALHYAELKELSWNNIYQRPDLQLTSIILKLKDNYKALYNLPLEYSRLAMVDASYNGGMGRIHTDRRLCGLKLNCDPNRWFKNVELTCGASKKAIYGNRTACMINREHVEFVMKVRSEKYKPWFIDNSSIVKSISIIKQPIIMIEPTEIKQSKPITVKSIPVVQPDSIVQKKTIFDDLKEFISNIFS